MAYSTEAYVLLTGADDGIASEHPAHFKKGEDEPSHSNECYEKNLRPHIPPFKLINAA